MTEFKLVQDFALIMVTAGAVTLLFHKFRQPPLLGYLIAGLLVGPYLPTGFAVADVTTIRLLADLGIVVLLFGLGLEFPWSMIRTMGLAAPVIALVEVTGMMAVGYLVGRLLGWPALDALFLGCALSITSSAIVTKFLEDAKRLHLRFSGLVVSILVTEDFAAVLMLSILSAVASVGTTDAGDVGFLMMKLVVFTVVVLLAGRALVPRVVDFASQFHSREAMLITSFGLCFLVAYLGNYLGLSAAAGAFFIGAILGETKQREEIKQLTAPVRHIFAAIFFVSIGMLLDVTKVGSFLVPLLILVPVFVIGKILFNTLAVFGLGFGGRNAFQVGMTMPQAGEFSLVMAKTGMDSGALLAPLYPVVTATTMFTTLTTPYLMRYADAVAGWVERCSPRFVKTYFYYLSRWLHTLRNTLGRRSPAAARIRQSNITIITNLLIMAVFVGTGTAALHLVESIAPLIRLRVDITAALLGFLTLALCLPSLVVIWKSLRKIIHEASKTALGGLSSSPLGNRESLRVVLGESIALGLMVVLALWSLPLVLGLFGVGSMALGVPIVLGAVILYLSVRSVRRIHRWVERSFHQTLEGSEKASGPPDQSEEKQD